MSTDTSRQLGRTAGKLLHDRLAETGILDQLYSRILATAPAVVQEAQATDQRLLRMFRTTASQYAMCFGCASLAIKASTMLFTKRFLGSIPISDKRAWGEFTEGVLEYATDSMKHPATRSDIIEDINDYEHAVARLIDKYLPEAGSVILDATQQIETIASEVLDSLGGKRSSRQRTQQLDASDEVLPS